MNSDPKKGKGWLSNRLTSMKTIPCLDQDLTEKEGEGEERKCCEMTSFLLHTILSPPAMQRETKEFDGIEL